MTLSEVLLLLLVVVAAIGYGLREYALFVATYRNPTPPFPYPPERLWRRLKVSLVLIVEAALLALTLGVSRSGARPVTSLVLALASVSGLVWLAATAYVDLRETRRQYARLKNEALADARAVWLATSHRQKPHDGAA